MNRRDHIPADPEVLGGKPVVEGARLNVDFPMRLFAGGWTEEQVLESYPRLTRESLNDANTFATVRVRA